jgi:hypothetical protein
LLLLLLLLSSLFSDDYKINAGLGSAVCVVVVASGWAVRFGATQERRVCVFFVGPFSCTEKQDKS